MSSLFDLAITSCILIHISFLAKLSECYNFVSLEKDSLCFSTVPETATLGLNASSALIISLPNTTSYKELTMNWNKDFVCRFQVKTNNSGLFAVIQTIIFRNSLPKSDECLDYIQYSKSGKNTLKKKFCGEEIIASPSMYSFVEPGGSLDVEVFISKHPLRPYRYLELQVVFTSYRFCFWNYSIGDRPCSSKHTVHCIYQGFFNDGYVNCPYSGCVDEPSCRSTNIEPENGSLSFHIALTSVFVMLVACTIIACYLGNKFKKFCWNRSSPRTYQRPSAQDDPSCMQRRSIFVTEPPEAPPIDDSLPPSYNSLFPDK